MQETFVMGQPMVVFDAHPEIDIQATTDVVVTSGYAWNKTRNRDHCAPQSARPVVFVWPEEPQECGFQCWMCDQRLRIRHG